jgi:type II secretory pathway pseudopilin PulG
MKKQSSHDVAVADFPLREAPKSSGFTLIELLCSFCILGLIIVFGVPVGAEIYQKNVLAVVVDDIQQAVSSAKMSGRVAELVPVSETLDWSDGMRLSFSGRDEYTWHWRWPGLHVSWHGFQSSHQLTFSKAIAESTTNGYFLIQIMHQHITITLNRMARMRVTR